MNHPTTETEFGDPEPPLPKTLPQKALRVVVITISILALLFILALIPITWVASGIPSKDAAPHSAIYPAEAAQAAIPIAQLENHTCGYLALASAYKAYGLSPDAENIRFRLGVDRVANPFDNDSTGALHPDILRVLSQDHFKYSFIDPETEESARVLCDHLASRQLALLLVERRASGNMHWVVADQCKDGDVRIVDSLAPEPYFEPASTFFTERVLSVLLIQPNMPAIQHNEPAPHTDGMTEMARVRSRLKNRK